MISVQPNHTSQYNTPIKVKHPMAESTNATKVSTAKHRTLTDVSEINCILQKKSLVEKGYPIEKEKDTLSGLGGIITGRQIWT